MNERQKERTVVASESFVSSDMCCFIFLPVDLQQSDSIRHGQFGPQLLKMGGKCHRIFFIFISSDAQEQDRVMTSYEVTWPNYRSVIGWIWSRHRGANKNQRQFFKLFRRQINLFGKCRTLSQFAKMSEGPLKVNFNSDSLQILNYF